MIKHSIMAWQAHQNIWRPFLNLDDTSILWIVRIANFHFPWLSFLNNVPLLTQDLILSNANYLTIMKKTHFFSKIMSYFCRPRSYMILRAQLEVIWCTFYPSKDFVNLHIWYILPFRRVLSTPCIFRNLYVGHY